MYRYLVALFAVTLICSCGGSEQEFVPPIDDITVDFELVRYEEALRAVATDSTKIEERLAALRERYPAFSQVYFDNVLPLKGKDNAEFTQNLLGFLNDERIVRLQDTTALVFANMEAIKTDFDQAYRTYKYYFPEFEGPNIYTYISEFSHQAFIFPDGDKDGIGLGLDMFLGSTYPYVRMSRENPAFSKYLVRAFNKDHIVRKGMYLIVDDMLGSTSGNRLIDHMIHNGKRLYILDKVLPTVHDSIIMEYSVKEMSWVQESELGMWSFFFDQDLFYETNSLKINKYVNPSPESPGMPEDAPGRTANYMGWQIVKAYMQRHPDTSLSQLVRLTDAQQIMDRSKYKPKQK